MVGVDIEPVLVVHYYRFSNPLDLIAEVFQDVCAITADGCFSACCFCVHILIPSGIGIVTDERIMGATPLFFQIGMGVS